jgi:Zn-dependent protease
MFRSWKIGRLFGIDIYLHWTFWILPILFIWHTKAYTLTTAALAMAAIAIFFFFIVLHEFGHILTARAFGIGTRDVILTPLGGMARLERMSENPLEEILIALAGPAVNVVAVILLVSGTLLSVGAFPFMEYMKSGTQTIKTGWDLLALITLCNVGMAMFNMLPAFPMDGGRVFRGVLAALMDRVTATTVAVYVGTVVIGVVGLLFFLMGNFLMLPLAVFIALIGHLELSMVKRKDAWEKHQAYERRRHAEPDERDEVIVPGLPPEPGFSGYSWNAQAGAWIEWRDGIPVRACRMRAG